VTNASRNRGGRGRLALSALSHDDDAMTADGTLKTGQGRMRNHRWAPFAVVAAVAALGAAGCGKSQDATTTTKTAASAESALSLSPTTPAGTGAVASVEWATYTPVATVDPIQAYDYPSNTAVALMCESVLAQQPDGSIEPGVTTASHPDPKTLVLKVDPKATFWNGDAVTAEDVAYSLNRNLDPKLGGLYGLNFDRVKSIAATGDDEVTVTLTKPDYWLDGELSQMPGVVVQKAFAEKAGKAFGTPAGGTMCTGSYELADWKAGDVLTAKANPKPWHGPKPLVGKISLRGVPDESALTSALLTNELGGYYSPGPLGTLKRLQAGASVTVHQGPSFATDMLAISATDGPLANAKVRQALSMAMDRSAYVDAAYAGTAVLPRTLANPGTWGYGRSVFEKDWNARPEPTLDVAAAKQIVQDEGMAGQTITIGTSQQIPSIATAIATTQNAAESIGLKVKLKSVSAAQYVAFFSDPKAFGSVDGFPTITYPDYADPAGLYKTFGLPGGSQNFSGYENPEVTKLLDEARSTADDDARATLVAKAGDVLATDLPWIPLVAPSTVLITDATLTGAPTSFSYMGAPWANTLGAKG
jgi:peptide/nickel transport system substrate-binding protein